MRTRVAAIVLVSAMACGAPEDGDVTPWAVRLASPQPSAAQSRVVAERIGSRDPLDTVWGAYLAGELGMSAMEDSLAGLTWDGPLLRGAALDALARIGGHIPDERLRELMAAAPMTAMAVALQEPAAHRDLVFDAFVTAHDALPDAVGDFHSRGAVSNWRAYANALTWLRDRDFAAVLLATLETSIEVKVVSPGHVSMGFGCRCGGAFGISCIGFSHAPFSALPPVGTWSIRETGDDACAVLLPGPTDVCLARVEGRLEASMRERALSGLPLRHWVSSIGQDAALAVVDDADGAGDLLDEEAAPAEDDRDTAYDDEGPPAEAREACPGDTASVTDELEVVASALNDELLRYLSALSGEQLSFEGRLSLLHVWRGEAAYRAEVEALRERIRAAHAAIGRVLADTYRLPDDHRPPSPAVEVFATDDRSCGATTALPRL